MGYVYPISKRLVPEFEVLCRKVEAPIYVPIITGVTLDAHLISSPEFLSQLAVSSEQDVMSLDRSSTPSNPTPAAFQPINIPPVPQVSEETPNSASID